ncbi:MAG: hypothetical protein KJ799_02675 [Bacteroidetes bacterium]|nr:hypothetical protein [Bacteroidota bacterium]MBU2505614.1 hypothetical protein [Bacteroidota bacterium]
MDTIKIKKKINSSSLTISNLDKFKGKVVEIIIIAEQELLVEKSLSKRRSKTINVAGILERYKDPLKKAKEAIAWELAVKGKYANS